MADQDWQTPHADEMAALQAHHDEQVAKTLRVGSVDVVRFLMDQELRGTAEHYLERFTQYPDKLKPNERAQLEALMEGGVDAYEKMVTNQILERRTAGVIDGAKEEAINREAGMINAREIIDGMYSAALERDAGTRTDSNSCRIEDLGNLGAPVFTEAKEGGCNFVKGKS